MAPGGVGNREVSTLRIADFVPVWAHVPTSHEAPGSNGPAYQVDPHVGGDLGAQTADRGRDLALNQEFPGAALS